MLAYAIGEISTGNYRMQAILNTRLGTNSLKLDTGIQESYI